MPKRPDVDDKEMDDLFGRTEKPPPEPGKFDRKTYLLLPGIHAGLKRIAEEEDVGVNDLVRWILGDFIRRYEKGELELPKVVQEIIEERVRLVNP